MWLRNQQMGNLFLTKKVCFNILLCYFVLAAQSATGKNYMPGFRPICDIIADLSDMEGNLTLVNDRFYRLSFDVEVDLTTTTASASVKWTDSTVRCAQPSSCMFLKYFRAGNAHLLLTSSVRDQPLMSGSTSAGKKNSWNNLYTPLAAGSTDLPPPRM